MGDWTEEIRREERIYPPVHPGEILHMEFLEPRGTWHPTSSPRAQACPRSASAASWCAGRKQRSPLIFPARLGRSSVWARISGQESRPATTCRSRRTGGSEKPGKTLQRLAERLDALPSPSRITLLYFLMLSLPTLYTISFT